MSIPLVLFEQIVKTNVEVQELTIAIKKAQQATPGPMANIYRSDREALEQLRADLGILYTLLDPILNGAK